MVKKTALILTSLIAITVIAVLAYFAFFRDNTSQNNVSEISRMIAQLVNNPVERLTDDSVVIERNDNYLITYDGTVENGTFYIIINNEPLEVVANQAEQSLEKKLKISHEQMCNIKVLLNVPSSLDANLANYNFGLSFCPTRPHIEDIPRQTDRVVPYSTE